MGGGVMGWGGGYSLSWDCQGHNFLCQPARGEQHPVPVKVRETASSRDIFYFQRDSENSSDSLRDIFYFQRDSENSSDSFREFQAALIIWWVPHDPEVCKFPKVAYLCNFLK